MALRSLLFILAGVCLEATLGCNRKLTPNEQPPSTALADPDYDRTSNTQSCDRFCAGFCATCGGRCSCEMQQKPSSSRGYAGMGGKQCLGVCTGASRDSGASLQPR